MSAAPRTAYRWPGWRRPRPRWKQRSATARRKELLAPLRESVPRERRITRGGDYGTDRAVRDSIHVEPGGVFAHRILVCRAPLIGTATRVGLGATPLGPCLPDRRRHDPGSRRRRPRRADGISDDDRIWRPDNGP